MTLIDLDKFVASFITEMKECSQMRNFSIPRCIKKALEEQGLEYKDGEIVKSQRRISAEAKETGYGESDDERIRDVRRRSTIQVLEYARSLDTYNQYGKTDIDKNISWLEKQVPIDEEKVLIGARKDVALSIMNFIDRNTLGMDLSSMECADLESAVIDSDWSKVYNYMKKKLETQGEKPQGKSALEAIKEEKIDNSNHAKLADNAEPKNENTHPLLSDFFKAEYERGKADAQKPTIDIEIPFGAKNSELQEATYYIPKGFYAEIDDDKVVIKKGEKSAEWSEEDEKNLTQCIEAIDACYKWDSMIDWLKSLKDRYTWKPSEGQLECLGYAIDKAEKDWSPLTNNRIYLTLKALKEQLEKL